jgi:hypothetical protein
MNAIKRNRLLVVLAALLLVGIGSLPAQTPRLELNVPDFDLFTPTDWIDAATFTLKESIPAGISGSIISNSPTTKWYLWGRVTKQSSGDPAPVTLATFWINSSTPIYTNQDRGGGEFSYELSVGALSRGNEFNVSYRENKDEVNKLKDQMKTGIASLTGSFTLDVRLIQDNPGPEGSGAAAAIVRSFRIPFSTATQAKIIIQVDPVVTVPNPTITVVLPPERSQTGPDALEYEIAVYRVEDNPRDAVQNGRPLWSERVRDGRTIHTYPQNATPLVVGAQYVVAGKTFIQSSANRDKVPVDADLVVFRYGEVTGSTSGGGGTTQGGQDANRPDPLLTVFGNAAPQVPPQLAQQLTTTLRRLEERGWTFSQIRFNNRPITPAELLQLLGQFSNATVTVVE